MSVIRSLLEHQLLQINESIAAHEIYDKEKTLENLRKSRDEIISILASLPKETPEKPS